MGEVYLAEDTALGRQVAVKFLAPKFAENPDARARFDREARAMAAVSHPNVVTIHQVGETDGRPYLMMEFVEGESLREVLERETLSLVQALDIAMQLASGLARVHERGIAHRDVKPSNVIIDRDGRPRLLDFGLATSREDDEITRTGEALGTLCYMSPEQAEGRPTDARSDLFSFGVVLYEMLAGKPPFGGDSLAATVRAILFANPESLRRLRPEVPEALERSVLHLLEKDPTHRPDSIETVLNELRNLAGASTTSGFIFGAAGEPVEASIAVLPFINMSADPEQEYFCDGMTEELIAALTKIEGLRVPARTSCFSFKGSDSDLREVGRKLRVNTVLEGSVRKAGNRLRITTQLVDVAEDRQLWSERYDRELEDVFAIQDEVTLAIVERLKPQLLGEARQRTEQRPSRDVEAYNLLLKGRFFANKRTEEGIKRAIDYYRSSVERDPAYAPAYAELAFGQVTLASYALVPPSRGYAEARESVEKAVELDSDLSAAQCALGVLEWEERRNARDAERAFLRVLEQNPNHAHTLAVISEMYSALGRHDEAIELGRRVAQNDPLSPLAILWLATTLAMARRYDEAEEALRRGRELDPDFLPGLSETAEVAVQQGRLDDALEAATRAASLGGDQPMYIALRGRVGAIAGRPDDARDALRRLEDLAAERYVPAFEIALLHTVLGDADAAFGALERAVDERYWRVLFLRVDPRLDSLRDDPRFEPLVERLGIEG
jgi:serine/threonine-protein kinase